MLVPQTDFCVIDENFVITRIRPKCRSISLTGKIPIGVTERGSLKHIRKWCMARLFKGCAQGKTAVNMLLTQNQH